MLWKLIQWLFGLSSRRGTYGSAQWLTGIRKWKILNRWNKGFICDGRKSGRLPLSKSYTHLAIIAPTGAGKTSRFVLPNILHLSDISCVVTDPSGEIYENSHRYLLSKGYLVKVLTVSDIQNSLQYNPLYRCHSFDDIQKLASLLVDVNYQGSVTDPYWTESSKNIISILLRIVKQLPPEDSHLGELYRLLNLFGHRQQEVDQLAVELLDDNSFLEYSAFVRQSDKTISNILSSARSAINIFSNPDMVALTREETLFFETLRTQKTALFLIIPENEVRNYQFILTVLYSQIFDFAMELPVANQPYIPILGFLDEFGNMGKIPNFSSLITTLRKRKFGLSIILQDIAMLQSVYGHNDASVILNGGCSSKIYYPGLSYTTCQELSSMLGNQTMRIRESSFGRQSGQFSGRDREIGRALMTPDEIRVMPQNRAIFLHGRELPILLKTKPYFKSRKLMRRARGRGL